MAHAIEMFFDDKADAAVRKIWDVLDYQPIAATVTTMGITDTRTGEVTQLTP
jgi:hypothetical protein